jgi:phosphatidylglycerophosphatase B
MHRTNTRIGCVFVRLLAIMLPAFVLLPLTYVVPCLNPLSLPHFDLTGPFAIAAYWVAESGGKFGIPAIAAIMIFVHAGRSGLSWRQRTVEVLVIILVAGPLLGGGAYLNEHVVKPTFHVPRPNIIELATTPADSPALKISAEEFYSLPDKTTRSAHLADILRAPDFETIQLHERIREHWISETGYSFPSGHSFSSMMFATFFLAMGLACCSGRRLWVFYLLVPWAVMVCYSRTVLRVHSPTDISIGGFEGIVVGILAFLLVRLVLVIALSDPTRSAIQPRDGQGP